MVPQQATQERPPDASCARCACRLSQYRDAWEQHCAPCRRTLVAEGALTVPAFDPAAASAAEQARQAATRHQHKLADQEKAALPGIYQKCECGRGYRKRRAKQCAQCRAESRKYERVPGAKWGRMCKCGGTKSKGAEMCMRCRYGIIAA